VTILSDFRRIGDALERLAATQTRLVRATEASQPAEQRLADLELSRSQFESDCEGLLMKAEGKLKAAANAEARERTMQKNYENGLDPFAEDSEEVAAPLSESDDETGDPEGMHVVHLGVAPKSKKAEAVRFKWS